jgi:heat shock protein HslJ
MKIRTFNPFLRFLRVVTPISLLLSACVPITPVPEQEAPATEATAVPGGEGDALMLEGVDWQLTEYLAQDGALAAPVAAATITFQDEQSGGNAGCNRFSAGYSVEGQQLTFDQAVSTMMACAEPIMAQEQAFFANLGLAASYEIVENQLNIFNAEGDTLLSFEPQVAASLTGVVWQATNYNNGKEAVVTVLEDTEITANFGEDGTVSGSAGCNNYSGTYTVDGDQISIGPLAMTRMACVEPAGVMEQETAYVMALETAAVYAIQGDVLELRTAEGALAARYVTMDQMTVAPPATEDGSQLSGVLTGTVTYLQRIALPSGSVIEVQLQDVSRADAAAQIIASQTITTAGENVPIPFTLTYDPAQIDPRYTYALGVRITNDGQLRWITAEHTPVLTGGAPMTGVEVVVQPAQ